MRLKLLQRLRRVVDEREARALTTAVLRTEAEDGNLVFTCLVDFRELGAKFVLGDVGAVGMKDVAGNCTIRCLISTSAQGS